MRELQVTVKHTPTIIKTTERYVSDESYKRNDEAERALAMFYILFPHFKEPKF